MDEGKRNEGAAMSGNGSVARGEAREGASEREMGNDGSVGEKAYGEAENGLRMENEKTAFEDQQSAEVVSENGKMAPENQPVKVKDPAKRALKVMLAVIGTIVVAMVAFLTFAFWGAKELMLGTMDQVADVKHPERKVADLPDGEIAVDHIGVQELYRKFMPRVPQSFYNEELSGRETLEGKGRLEIALSNTGRASCRAMREGAGKCYRGEDVRAIYRRLFGDEIKLTGEEYGQMEGREPLFVYYDGDGVGKVLTLWYAMDEDEFYEVEGGFDSTSRYVSRLEGVKKAGDSVILRERVVQVNCRPDPQEDGAVGSACSVIGVAATCGTAEFGWTGADKPMIDGQILDKAAEKGFGGVELKFRETAEGGYVFEGMRLVMDRAGE